MEGLDLPRPVSAPVTCRALCAIANDVETNEEAKEEKLAFHNLAEKVGKIMSLTEPL